MSQELVVKHNSTGEMTKFNSARKKASDSIIYFISGLFYVFAPFAGNHIDNFRSTMIERNRQNFSRNSNKITFVRNSLVKKNNVENLEKLTKAFAWFMNTESNTLNKCSRNIIEAIESNDNKNFVKFLNEYNKKNFSYRKDSIRLKSDVNKSNGGFYSLVEYPDLKLNDLFGITVLTFKAEKNNKNGIYRSLDEFNGKYVISSKNISDNVLEELFEIQEKIDELNKDLKQYENSSEIVKERNLSMKNKMAEKLLTVDPFSPVIYSHQKPKSDNKTKHFWDQDRNVVFSIVDERDKKKYKENASISEVLFAGEGYPTVIYILPMSIENFLDIDFSDLVKEVWGEEEFAQDKVHKEKISEDFEDIKKWELEVNIVGEYGYHNVFADEKNKVINEMNSFVEQISLKLGKRLIESFFNYADSTVLDLSVVNDVVCFKWDIGTNDFLIKPEEIMNYFEIYWKNR